MALPTMAIILVGIPKLFKCVVLAHLCRQNEIFFIQLFPTKTLLSKTQRLVDGKLSSMGFFLQRPIKKIPVNSFTWGGAVLKELGFAVY